MSDAYYRIYDFLAWKRLIFFLSIFLFFISCSTMITRGFNWGLDFTGGMSIDITSEKDINLINVKNILVQSGFKNPTAQYFGSPKDIMIQLPLNPNVNKINQDTANIVLHALQESMVQNFFIKQTNWIGPSAHSQLINTGIMALLVALICILIYITFRFEWRLATGVVISLTYDIIVILGMLSLLTIKMDSTIIAALMSAIGYSINDKIVIFDRIRENFYYASVSKPIDIFNISLSQVLSRTIITSVTTIIVLLILLVFGGDMLYGFAVTLLLGTIIGTVSSIYIASSLAFKFGTARDHFIKIN
ncbi:protein translocase subunit SecF [Blochmannia endosymbiont of Camponotus sp. C-046]|uniref:protein translocase subunit SecF n=1 Tax=Blochmannia endosymbiont of Camponotus sp. C-046 TaxID=2945589 RepID=UPI0020250F33|nr:protein translocase subunit SecF [Blochmannia endosymbiont of Camponotus sp. C-046]URJ28490.1 protein translocase subunit SecF [Blochmannia endosymbiont of Camponotus sp. C-046]